MKFPNLIASSVIRSSCKGNSHGGIYLIDLNNETYKQVLDWNDGSISWEGRGGDRGLKGIVLYDDKIYIAASNEIFIFDKEFNILKSFRNQYLRHCHETYVSGNILYLTSTHFNSILEFDLIKEKFIKGYLIRYSLPLPMFLSRRLPLFKMSIFDPNLANGPEGGDVFHINNVHVKDNTIYLSGTKLGFMLMIKDGKLKIYSKIPFVSHNAQPFQNGIIMNSTAEEAVSFFDLKGNLLKSFPVKRYDPSVLTHTELPDETACQAFGRGYCNLGNGYIAAGSSPANVSIYDFNNERIVKNITLTMDIRNAIHGLEVWPYDV